MIKYILIIFILISLGDCTLREMALGDTYCENLSGHTDNIYGVYNDSCIETVNYLYLFYTSPDNETYIKEGLNIWLENITQIGPKAYKADLYYLD